MSGSRSACRRREADFIWEEDGGLEGLNRPARAGTRRISVLPAESCERISRDQQRA